MSNVRLHMRCICFIASMALATGASACDWPTRSLAENERASDTVFIAAVIDRKSTSIIELEVVELFKGSAAGRVEIPTISDCDFFVDRSIRKGERFLVFVTRTERGPYVGIGGGTARYVEGNADITYIRAKYRK